MKKEHYIDNIYMDVKALGFVDNQLEFSVLCGRTPAWFSAIKARSLPITTDAMLTLSYNLRSRAKDAGDISICNGAKTLSVRLIEDAQELIGKKARRLSSSCD
jgi:hypothetical protein